MELLSTMTKARDVAFVDKVSLSSRNFSFWGVWFLTNKIFVGVHIVTSCFVIYILESFPRFLDVLPDSHNKHQKRTESLSAIKDSDNLWRKTCLLHRLFILSSCKKRLGGWDWAKWREREMGTSDERERRERWEGEKGRIPCAPCLNYRAGNWGRGRGKTVKL